jgi:hypothetical protein
MMEISRTIDKKRRQLAPMLDRESFDLARRRGETQARTPFPEIDCRNFRTNIPGIIQIEMQDRTVSGAHEKIL